MLDDVKNLSFSVVVFLVGAILLLLALIGDSTVGSVNFSVAAPVRVTAAAIGVALCLFAIVIEVPRRTRERSPLPERVASPPATQSATPAAPETTPGTASSRVPPESFFFTLEDIPDSRLSAITTGARCFSMVSRTAVNLLSSHGHQIERLAQSGCDIRFLVLDPSSEACAHVYGGSPKIFKQNIELANTQFGRLRKSVGKRLEIRMTKHAPTMSIMWSEFDDPQRNVARVQLYFFHSVLGSDRPLFAVPANDKWYRVFVSEFETLWKDAQPWPA